MSFGVFCWDVTKQEGEDYEAFLGRAIKVPGARLIKEADIADNYGRLHLIQDDATRERLKAKYKSALKLLEEAGSR